MAETFNFYEKRLRRYSNQVGYGAYNGYTYRYPEYLRQLALFRPKSQANVDVFFIQYGIHRTQYEVLFHIYLSCT